MPTKPKPIRSNKQPCEGALDQLESAEHRIYERLTGEKHPAAAPETPGLSIDEKYRRHFLTYKERIAFLEARLTECQRRGTELVEENRGLQIRLRAAILRIIELKADNRRFTSLLAEELRPIVAGLAPRACPCADCAGDTKSQSDGEGEASKKAEAPRGCARCTCGLCSTHGHAHFPIKPICPKAPSRNPGRWSTPSS